LRTLTSSTDLLAGGFLLCFASSLGQTWFIALAASPVRVELGLSHGAFGGLYSAATLASGVTLMWIGAKVDRATPRRFALGLALAIGLAALGMALVRHPLMLVLVFFALRLSGQGLLTHLAMTTLARSFAATRGRALSIASLSSHG
jgi:sugar phosphate permease